MGTSVEAFAPAKINLALHVTGQRPDGYHTIDSLVAFADVGDLLHVEIDESADGPASASCTGPFGDWVDDSDRNLVVAAAAALAGTKATTILPSLSVVVDKQLPVAAGLGGGSADAAAMLRAASHLWQLPPDCDLASIGRRIGADVPMCLQSRLARIGGIGDEIVPAERTATYWAILVNPGIGLATSAVFSRLDNKVNAPIGEVNLPAAIDELREMRNDLEPAAISLVPEIADILRLIGVQHGCRLARMSGSGASCFGLFEDFESAARAKQVIAGRLPSGAWCVTAALGSPDISLRMV